MIHVGFTGTRYGMSDAQLEKLCELVAGLRSIDLICAHHGDCVGADAQFHRIAREHALVVVHPGKNVRTLPTDPPDESLRAFCAGDEVKPPIGHFARNRAIVDVATVIIGVPREAVRQPRGGTWYTIDRAKKSGKPLAVILPNTDGSASVEYLGSAWPGLWRPGLP